MKEDGFRDLELATFAVWQLAKMAKEYRTNYQKALVWRTGGRVMSELTPQHVLTDLFGSGDFPAEILDPEHAAEIVIRRLIDAGFEIKPTERSRI